MAAPKPAGPPPTTSTSVSAASIACRGGSAIFSTRSGRFRDGTGLLLRLQEFDEDLLRFLRALLEGRHGACEMAFHRAAAVPRLVEVSDQAPGIDEIERRRRDLQVFQQAGYLARVRQRDERHMLEGGEDEEVQAHADGEAEAAHEREQLAGVVLA